MSRPRLFNLGHPGLKKEWQNEEDAIKGQKMKRKKINKKTSKDLKKYTKEKLKKVFGGRMSRIYVHMICKECKREYKIRVNTKEQKEVFNSLKDTWVCMICRKGERR